MATPTTTIRATTITFGSCAAESEKAGVFNFASLYRAYCACRRRKRHTRNAQRYEAALLDNLVTTAQRLELRRWQPARSVFFIALKPKAREIHAADFADRVVHHSLVPLLEALFEPVFIHDVYSNRQGKGTHAAVDRLGHFMRGLSARQGHAFYLQLDVRNFFNSIHRPTLLELLRHRLALAVRQGKIAEWQAADLYWLCQRLLDSHPGREVIRRGPPEHFARVPAYKRLANTPDDRGLPIGNLTSQFFANVYLNELDQFIKHQLKCRHYLRYVDDFILLHEDPKQLQQWQQEIVVFLQQRLKLLLKPDVRLQPVTQGADFLGYVVFPNHRLVRRRVMGNLREKLNAFQATYIRSPHEEGQVTVLTLPGTARDGLYASLASYLGHLRHADCRALLERLWREFPWLAWIATYHWREHTAGRAAPHLLPRYKPMQVTSLRSQWRWFKRLYPRAVLVMQVGSDFEVYGEDALRLGALCAQTRLTRLREIERMGLPPGLGVNLAHGDRVFDGLRRHHSPWLRVEEEGFLRGGMRQRVLRQAAWSPSPGRGRVRVGVETQ
jgi:hypothetical protein